MDRVTLERLSRDELIELVIRLPEMVADVGQVPEQVGDSKQRVAEFEAEAVQPRAPEKTSAN